ncbi:hypothetical protein OROMI_023788 [Orobanche minor]
MATAKLIETHKNGAEIFKGDICKAKTCEFLDEISIPKGLMALDEVEEVGINRSTRFVWWKLKNKKEKKYKKIGQTVIYNVEITGFFEKQHLSNVTGVKSKELLIHVVINDILVGEPAPDMIKFTTPVGLSRSYPVSGFEQED